MKKANFNKPIHIQQSKHDEPWKEQAEEMSEFFGQSCYQIFYRLQGVYIDEAFRVCKEQDIHNIGYFWGVVKNHKKRVETFKEYNN